MNRIRVKIKFLFNGRGIYLTNKIGNNNKERIVVRMPVLYNTVASSKTLLTNNKKINI